MCAATDVVMGETVTWPVEHRGRFESPTSTNQLTRLDRKWKQTPHTFKLEQHRWNTYKSPPKFV